LALIRIFNDFLTFMASEEQIAANRRNALGAPLLSPGSRAGSGQ
jgi:hypothetical protein